MGGSGRARWVAAAACVVSGLLMGTSAAQTVGDPNPGAISLSGSMDASNAYLFRGLPQDDTGLILWPAADLSVALRSGGGTLRSVTVSLGTWNSLHTGVTGTDGPSGKLWYESDFSASVGLGFGGGVTFATAYTSYTSPNGAFATVKELSLKVGARVHGVSPYGRWASGRGGRAAGGVVGGGYLGLGRRPVWGWPGPRSRFR